MTRSLIHKLRMKILWARDPIAWARRLGVSVGDDCRFLGVDATTFGSEPYLITIGDHVTITRGVRFVTHDGGVWVLRPELPELDVFGRIIVGNNVFIGINSILMPGTVIQDNVVIGAASVVRGDVPPNTIFAGVPARMVSGLDEYRSRSAAKGLKTKGMSPSAKKSFLLDHFGVW